MHYRGSTPHRNARGKDAPAFVLGLNVLVVEGRVTVRSCTQFCPVADIFQANDILHELDHTPCRSVESLRNACLGSAGSLLRIQYTRPPDTQYREVVLERALRSDGTGFFRLPQEQSKKTVQDFINETSLARSRLGASDSPEPSHPEIGTADVKQGAADRSCMPSAREPEPAGQHSPNVAPHVLSVAEEKQSQRTSAQGFSAQTLDSEVSRTQHQEQQEADLGSTEQTFESKIETTQIKQIALRLLQAERDLEAEVARRQEAERLLDNERAQQEKRGTSERHQTLIRRNKALESELQALTEDLNDHYVPITVLESVVRERDQLQRQLHDVRLAWAGCLHKDEENRVGETEASEDSTVSVSRSVFATSEKSDSHEMNAASPSSIHGESQDRISGFWLPSPEAEPPLQQFVAEKKGSRRCGDSTLGSRAEEPAAQRHTLSLPVMHPTLQTPSPATSFSRRSSSSVRSLGEVQLHALFNESRRAAKCQLSANLSTLPANPAFTEAWDQRDTGAVDVSCRVRHSKKWVDDVFGAQTPGRHHLFGEESAVYARQCVANAGASLYTTAAATLEVSDGESEAPAPVDDVVAVHRGGVADGGRAHGFEFEPKNVRDSKVIALMSGASLRADMSAHTGTLVSQTGEGEEVSEATAPATGWTKLRMDDIFATNFTGTHEVACESALRGEEGDACVACNGEAAGNGL